MNATKTTGRKWLRRLGAVFAGLLFILIALEVTLQIAAMLQLRSVRSRLQGSAGEGRPIVAFVGDSNIYGLYLEPNDTMPKWIERASRQNGKTGIATVNLGYPSQPTWDVLEQAKRALEYRPAALVVRAGINNFVSIPPEGGGGIAGRLRIVKLAKIVWFNLHWDKMESFELNSGVGGQVADADGRKMNENESIIKTKNRDGGEEFVEMRRYRRSLEYAQIEPRLRSDFTEIARLCEAAGAKCILATYLAGAKGGFADITKTMLTLEGVHGTRVADCSRIVSDYAESLKKLPGEGGSVAEAVANGTLLTLDDHPTAAGCAAEGSVIAKILKSAGISNDLPETDPLSVAPSPEKNTPKLAQGRGDGLPFLYQGRAGDRVQVLFGVSGNCSYEHLPVPLQLTSWRRGAPMFETRSTAVADALGAVRIVYSGEQAAAAKEATHAIAVVRRGGKGGASQVLLSPPIEVRRN